MQFLGRVWCLVVGNDAKKLLNSVLVHQDVLLSSRHISNFLPVIGFCDILYKPKQPRDVFTVFPVSVFCK